MAAIGHRAKSAFTNFKRVTFVINRTKVDSSFSNHVRATSYLTNIKKIPKLQVSRCFHLSTTLQKIVAFNLSDIGEGIREVTVKEWFVNVGDKVSQFDKICEVQSDKASVTITSRYDGVITKIHHEVDSIALVGDPLIDIEVSGESDEVTVDSSSTKDKLPGSSSVKTSSEKPLASPAVRRMVSENKLRLSHISGTGRYGHVLKQDVVNYLSRRASEPIPAGVPDNKQRIQGYKKAMVKTMTESRAIPHFVYSDAINVAELVKLYSRLKQASEARGVKLTYMPFFIKAASLALKQYPVINASVDENCEHIIYHSVHNIGVAMDTSDGLVVPNIKNVQDLSIYQIASELNRLQKLGQQGSFSVADVTGGTLTLSNIGAIGGTYCAPLILPPEVAIGAIGKIQVVPRFDTDGAITRASMMTISWAADHRVIDGATMARFSNRWKEYIEEPHLLLLDN